MAVPRTLNVEKDHTVPAHHRVTVPLHGFVITIRVHGRHDMDESCVEVLLDSSVGSILCHKMFYQV